MTGTTRSSADLDIPPPQGAFPLLAPGMREVDLILGSFADGEESAGSPMAS